MSESSSSLTDLLSQLSDISSSLYRATFPLPSDDLSHSFGLGMDIPDFLLPFPELGLDVPCSDCLVEVLVGVGAPLELARELSEIHAECTAELANHCTQAYREACLQLANDRPKTDNASLTKMYLRLQRTDRRLYKQTIEAWEADFLQVAQRRYKSSEGSKFSTAASTFKPNFAPILEEVYKENPFPSIVIKKALASKSGMSLNQIKIWFQNHRSRARKIGKRCSRAENQATDKGSKNSTSLSPSSSSVLVSSGTSHSSRRAGKKRGTGAVQLKDGQSAFETTDADDSSSRSIASLFTDNSILSPISAKSPNEEDRTPGMLHIDESNSSCAPSDCETVVGSDSDELYVQESTLSRSSSVTFLDEVYDSLYYQPPYYAFPTRYPPDIDEDPFPCRVHGNLSFSKPVWPRSPCSKPVECAVTDISELECKFSSLTLAPSDDDVLIGNQAPSSAGFVTTYPFITPTYTAPLPFLLRNYQPLSEPTRSLIPSGQQSPFSPSTTTSCTSSQSKACEVQFGKIDLRNSLGVSVLSPDCLSDMSCSGAGCHCEIHNADPSLTKVSLDAKTPRDIFTAPCIDSSPTWWFEEIFSHFPDPIGLSSSFTTLLCV